MREVGDVRHGTLRGQWEERAGGLDEEMRRTPTAPFVISLFVSHAGCFQRCLFCDQEKTTGWTEKNGQQLDAATVREEVARQLAWPRRNHQAGVEVAFYGGSFTALPAARQAELLQAVEPFLTDGTVHRIRISTRPDTLDQKTVDCLWRHGVRVIELGVQSLDDSVLHACHRGHTAIAVEQAFSLLRQYPFQIGAHLMTGLPGTRPGEAMASARRLAALRPDFIRIHPTLVIRGSRLANLYESGHYQPQSLTRSVIICGKLKLFFDTNNIPVVRMGLQPTPSLAENILAGPWHPAFGELVRSWLLYRDAKRLIADRARPEPVVFRVAPADESAFRGKGNCNLSRLQRQAGGCSLTVLFDPGLPRGKVLLDNAQVHDSATVPEAYVDNRKNKQLEELRIA